MTPKQFIEKAIEGGWKLDLSQRDHCDGVPCDNDFLLDPLAWQAVGKVEGWNLKFNQPRGYFISPLEAPLIQKNDRFEQWQWAMHRMIDALVEGKTIEQFLETL